MRTQVRARHCQRAREHLAPLHWAVLGWDALDELLHFNFGRLSLQVLPVLPALDVPFNWFVLVWAALYEILHLAVGWVPLLVLHFLAALDDPLHWAVLGWDALEELRDGQA